MHRSDVQAATQPERGGQRPGSLTAQSRAHDWRGLTTTWLLNSSRNSSVQLCIQQGIAIQRNHVRYLCLSAWKRGSSRSTTLSDPRQRAANVACLLPIIARNNSSTRDDRGTPTDLACPWAARITSRSMVRVSLSFNFRSPSHVNKRPISPACVQAWMLHKRSQHLPCSVTPCPYFPPQAA